MLDLKKRKNAINFLKGMAILLVTYFHLWRSLGKRTLLIGDFDLTLPFHFGDLGVNLFVFLSGFLVVNSLKKVNSFRAFMKSKINSLFPLYFLAIIFYYISAKVGYPIASIHNLNSVILHLTFTHTLINKTTYSLAGVLWYMGLIMQLYAVGYFLYKLKKRRLLSIVLIVVITYISFNITHPLIAKRFIGKYLLIFYLGMLSNYCYNDFLKIIKNKLILALYLVFFIIYCFNTKVPLVVNFKYMNYTQGFVYLFFPMYLMIIEQFKETENIPFKVVTFLGEISYSLYLFNYSYIVLGKMFNYSYIVLGETEVVKGIQKLIFYSISLIVISLIANEVNKILKNKIKIRSMKSD